jgi:hypothetical protein
VTGNDHYNKALALYRQYEEELANHGEDTRSEFELAVSISLRLTRILQSAQVQMQMAEYKAKRVRG